MSSAVRAPLCQVMWGAHFEHLCCLHEGHLADDPWHECDCGMDVEDAWLNRATP